MKAVICPRYGPPDVLGIEDVEPPRPRPDEVLIRVHAAGVSVSDCVIRSGRVKPAMWLPFRIFVGFRRPRNAILGLELSGEVDEAGSRITRWKPGDQIMAFTGRHFGAYAEYVCLREKGSSMPADCVIIRKPDNITHAEAATAVTRAALALHFLRKAQIAENDRVLIYGASGGIGTFAVQLAKHFGAHVTAICSAANFDLARSLGADRVLDYTLPDESPGGPYQVTFDAVGTKKTSPLKSRLTTALDPQGKHITVDAPAKTPVALAEEAAALIAAGSIKPVVDRVYPLAETADAHRYVEGGHKRGGVVISMLV